MYLKLWSVDMLGISVEQGSQSDMQVGCLHVQKVTVNSLVNLNPAMCINSHSMLAVIV